MKDYLRIEDISLSNRSYNMLKRAGINTLKEIIMTPRDQLEKIKGLGSKSINEIFKLIDILNIIENNYSVYLASADKNEKNYDICLNDLPLSIDTINYLKSNGIKFYSQLDERSNRILKSMNNIDSRVFIEINNVKTIIKSLHYSNSNKNYINDINYYAKSYVNNNYNYCDSTIIEDLNLSNRSCNMLKRAGINTLKDIITTPRDQLEKIKGLGSKSISEIFKLIDEFEKYNFKNNINKVFIGKNGKKIIDIAIKNLSISSETTKYLNEHGIKYYSEAISIIDLNINPIILNEINSFSSHLEFHSLVDQFECVKTKKFIEEMEIENINLIIEVAKTLNSDVFKIMNDITQVYFNNSTVIRDFNTKPITKDETLMLIYETKYANIGWTNIILEFIKNEEYGITKEELYNRLPNTIKNNIIFKDIIMNLINSQKIELFYDNNYIYVFEDFKHGSKKYLSIKEYEILMSRITGKTLDEIGQLYKVTRERIRQIEFKALEKINKLNLKFKEDIYLNLYKTYNFTRDNFKLAFGEDKSYIYLEMRYSSKFKNNKNDDHKKPLVEIIEDINVPTPFRKAFEKVIYKNQVKIGDFRVESSRKGICNYIITNYAIKDLNYYDFKEIYFNVLNDINKLDDPILSTYNKSYENMIMNSRITLWKLGKIFRYYDIDSYDFTELLNTLDLNQYINVEFSTLKFLRQYPELMKNYDIKDEYELHNLLKKICDPKEYPNVKFNRMPNIEFGQASRDNQVTELLFILAPISKQDFAQKYEQYYGVNADTVSANYVSSIDKYLYNGYYQIDFYEFPEVIKIRMKEILVDEIYSISTIKKLFFNEFPHADKEMLNPLSLKSIGFKIYGNYIIKDYYNSSADYFNQLLTKDNLINLEEIDPVIKSIENFYSQLYKLKEEYEIIEFNPNRYINIKKLKEVGVTKGDLIQYCKDVLSFVREEKYFTIRSLKKDGFYNYLDELGFEEWFYTSILIEDKNNISYKRIGGNKIMFSGNYNFTFGDFLESIVYNDEHKYIDINDLIDILLREYGVKTEIYKLINFIKSTSMHYDHISERVYANYDIYYEEI